MKEINGDGGWFPTFASPGFEPRPSQAFNRTDHGNDGPLHDWMESGPRVTAAAAPELTIESTGTNLIRLTWDQDGNNRLLEADDPTVEDWNPVGVGPLDQGGTNWSVFLPIEVTKRLFRLLSDNLN